MDSSFLLIVAVVALGVWRFIARRRRKRERQQDDKRWGPVDRACLRLESSLQELATVSLYGRRHPRPDRPCYDVMFTAISTAPVPLAKSSEGTTEVAPLALVEGRVPRVNFPRRRCERQEPAGNGENTGCLRLCKTIPPKDCAKMSSTTDPSMDLPRVVSGVGLYADRSMSQLLD